ncbi:hypothetical protein BUE80_DR010590 [Diplocarpon rosae]|nr:hypothetical protein BUE80_DR010590 [Diplocarpon rosae]
MSSFLPNQWPLGSLSALFLLSSVIVLAVSKRKREALLGRLHFHRKRISGASTPPRSISPNREASIRSGPDYSTILPPSRRSVLPELARTLSPVSSKILLSPDPSVDFIVMNALPTAQSYSLDDQVPRYTPTGFSTAEIKAIGDFPAYDILSGVPLPHPYRDFDIAKALPRPYRPLRWKYHQTMSFQKLEPDWWLEVENSYVTRIKERQELFREHGSKVLDYLPGSELACKELMEMCLQFYCARYPAQFSLSADQKIFHNRILGTETMIKRYHPFHILLNNVPEDFAIVLRNEDDGMYYFRAGVICVVFNFKALFTPVTEFRAEPYIPALLLKILKEGKKELMEYKGTWHVEHVCIPRLEEYAQEQIAKGWVRADMDGQKEWNIATLAESPYFPGWEEKWHRQQGF